MDMESAGLCTGEKDNKKKITFAFYVQLSDQSDYATFTVKMFWFDSQALTVNRRQFSLGFFLPDKMSQCVATHTGGFLLHF